MRITGVLFLCLTLLTGCTTVESIKESGGDHPVAYLGVQTAVQIASYELAKSLKDKQWDKLNGLLEGVQSVQSEGGVIMDWDKGRDIIAEKVPMPYTSGALLVYGILETELRDKVEQGGITTDVAEKYIQATVIGIKSGFAQARAERG